MLIILNHYSRRVVGKLGALPLVLRGGVGLADIREHFDFLVSVVVVFGQFEDELAVFGV